MVQEGRVFLKTDVMLSVIDVCSAYRIVLSTPQALSKCSVDELNVYICHCA